MQTFMLIMHLAFMGLGIGMSCSNFVNTRLAAGKTGDIAKGLALQRRQIASIGDSVIAAIWLSGFILLQMRGWEGLNGWFTAKMVFVAALTVSHIMARRTGAEMMRTGNGALLSRVSMYIAGVWVSALIALALAVLAFE
jgi:preprotein translocase subunit SecG